MNTCCNCHQPNTDIMPTAACSRCIILNGLGVLDRHGKIIHHKVGSVLNQLRESLAKIESELDACRTSALQDGWQTSRHARKSRKWDHLAMAKMELLRGIEELEAI